MRQRAGALCLNSTDGAGDIMQGGVTTMSTASLTAAAGLSLFIGAMIHAAFTDITTMRIRNRIPGLLVLAYGGFGLAVGLPLGYMAASALVAVAVLGLGFLCFCRGWIGGGDAKLAGTAALWVGGEHALAFLASTAVAGCVLTLLLISFRFMQLPAHFANVPWLSHLHARQTGVPYGVALAAAALLVIPMTKWVDIFRYQ